MNKRCIYCTKLSIEALVELAKISFEAQRFPQDAYYQHHDSFSALEQSAYNGCDLCQVILQCFQQTPCEAEQPLEWPQEWNETTNASLDGYPHTMYSVAKGLDVSDVKLCINTSHLYDAQGLRDVQVFDETIVQVGTLHIETVENYGIWSFPQLVLRLSTPKDEAVHVERFRIGRFEVDPDLGSLTNHQLAKEWLTEVIDVGRSLNEGSVRLFLSHGLKAEYVALSHCWGGAISPLLTTESTALFQQNIDIEVLPANFHSLCIQQDSKSDWEIESKKMGLVYRNSTVTISAMVSGSSKSGIMKTSQSAKSSGGSTTLDVFGGNDNTSKVTVRRKNLREESLVSLDRQSALAERGWTLQEYILSPRHLLYGQDMIYWRCPRGFKSSDDLPAGNKSPQTVYKDVSRVICSDILRQPETEPLDINAVFRDYSELVNAYSQRRLTYGSDKLPAFSGLAQRLHPAIGGEYLAGIWTANFRQGLLWTAEMKFCQHVNEPYRAPSWSWAVTDDLVLFEGPQAVEEQVVLKSTPSTAKLLEYSINPTVPDNPYGEILSAKLVVEALTKPFVRSRQVVETILDQNSIGTANFDEPAGPEDSVPMGWASLFRMKTEGGDYIFSTITRPGDDADWEVDFHYFRADEYFLMLVYTDDDVAEDDETEWSRSPAFCLILRRTSDESLETYERVGFAKLQEPRLRWLKTWERCVLTLV
ncbi:heterokaryon incompatibility protein [Colletotrichum camelliae]|nr:heterokaryon incompatibility protein [Colletotrichum camelliae]